MKIIEFLQATLFVVMFSPFFAYPWVVEIKNKINKKRKENGDEPYSMFYIWVRFYAWLFLIAFLLDKISK